MNGTGRRLEIIWKIILSEKSWKFKCEQAIYNEIDKKW